MDKKQTDYDYRDTCEADQGIAVVGKNGKFGYINRRGKEITPIKYDVYGYHVFSTGLGVFIYHFIHIMWM